MNTMTDWKGNEIKPGMEVCIIKIIDKQYMVPGVLFPDGTCIMADREPDKVCWEIGPYYLVEGEKLIITESIGEFTFSQPLEIKCFFLDMNNYFLAIKGISDKL